ncbi:unnamed protein product [Blepharisma stoltei]|uniref:Uncharacterized protein n=1 Tax=Blepharisma stoltei TaxID=1481888 RepID=A0AAU9JA97_9CILI|nr:unnamed protein product [Blepharisma stoltei]
MSAFPSWLTSFTNLGNWSKLVQSPASAEFPNHSDQSVGAKNPVPTDNETHTPELLKPIMSAFPSPFTSATHLGVLLKLLHPEFTENSDVKFWWLENELPVE